MVRAVIDIPLRVKVLQDYCRDEVEPFVKQHASGMWGWAEETIAIPTYKGSNGEMRYLKRIHGIWFDKDEDASFFILKFANLLK